MSRFTKTRFSNHHIPSEQDILVMKKLGIIYSYMNTGQDDDIREIYLKVTEILDNKAKYTVHLVGMANQEKTTEILCGIVSASIRGDEETLRKLIPIKKISDDVAEIAKKLIGEFKREEQNPIEKRTREKIIYLMKRISEEGIKASPQTELRELKMLAEIYAYYQQTMDRTWYMKMSSYENLTDNYVVDKLNTFLNRIKIITGTYQRGIYQAKVGVCRDYIAVDLDYEENYYLSIQALDTELDPYLREGAIGIKLCDTTHNLLTLSKEPSRKRQQEYKYTALSDIFYREDYELFRLIFDPRAQKWINSWGRKNLRRFQGTTTIEYIPPI